MIGLQRYEIAQWTNIGKWGGGGVGAGHFEGNWSKLPNMKFSSKLNILNAGLIFCARFRCFNCARKSMTNSASLGVHRRLAHPVVHQMSLHPDDHQWATGGPPDVATSSGPPDVALAVGTRMLACGCNADADIKWPTGCTHPVVHPMCTHAVVHRMRTSTGHEDVRCWS